MVGGGESMETEKVEARKLWSLALDSIAVSSRKFGRRRNEAKRAREILLGENNII